MHLLDSLFPMSSFTIPFISFVLLKLYLSLFTELAFSSLSFNHIAHRKPSLRKLTFLNITVHYFYQLQ